MEVTWDEKLILTAIRVFARFPRPLAYVSGLSVNSVDGGYVEFSKGHSSCKIHVQLYPDFAISLSRQRTWRYMFRQFPPSINLVKEKNKYPEFSNLPEKFQNEDELFTILNGYKLFIEKHYLKDGEISF